MTRLAIATLVLAAACGSGDSKEGGGGGAKRAAELPADHVAAVNAALPEDLRGKLAFEAGRVVANEKRGTGYRAALPKGWKKGFLPGSLEPADADGFGSATLGKTRMSIGHNCDGTCEKKDWAAVSDKVLFAQFTGGRVKGKVVKDEKRPNGRTLVFEREPGPFADKDVAIDIHVAWWDPEAPRYHTCSAELGAPVKGAAAAFEKACSTVVED